jgi:hypothetical protein
MTLLIFSNFDRDAIAFYSQSLASSAEPIPEEPDPEQIPSPDSAPEPDADTIPASDPSPEEEAVPSPS